MSPVLSTDAFTRRGQEMLDERWIFSVWVTCYTTCHADRKQPLVSHILLHSFCKFLSDQHSRYLVFATSCRVAYALFGFFLAVTHGPTPLDKGSENCNAILVAYFMCRQDSGNCGVRCDFLSSRRTMVYSDASRDCGYG